MIFSKGIENKIMIFKAVVDIPKDIELTINYSGENGNNISDGNKWFEDRKITFIN